MMAPIWKEAEHGFAARHLPDVFQEHASTLTRPEDYVNHSLYFEAKTFLNGLLVVEDKLAMAHGLETRVPFLDNDLVDFAMRLPASMKLGNLTEVITHQRKRARRQGRALFRADQGRQADPAQDDGGATFRTKCSRTREAGLLRAGRELVQGREHRLRSPPLDERSRTHL